MRAESNSVSGSSCRGIVSVAARFWGAQDFATAVLDQNAIVARVLPCHAMPARSPEAEIHAHASKPNERLSFSYEARTDSGGHWRVRAGRAGIWREHSRTDAHSVHRDGGVARLLESVVFNTSRVPNA